jgi:hypothetical protein
MKSFIAFNVCAAALSLAVSAHAVQATGTNIGLVIKPSTPVARVIKPTQTPAGGETAGVSGPKVRPMTGIKNTQPAKAGR